MKRDESVCQYVRFSTSFRPVGALWCLLCLSECVDLHQTAWFVSALNETLFRGMGDPGLARKGCTILYMRRAACRRESGHVRTVDVFIPQLLFSSSSSQPSAWRRAGSWLRCWTYPLKSLTVHSFRLFPVFTLCTRLIIET